MVRMDVRERRLPRYWKQGVAALCVAVAAGMVAAGTSFAQGRPAAPAQTYRPAAQPGTAEENPRVVALRVTANGGGEIEFFAKSLGFGLTYVPGFHTVDVTSNGSTVCSAKWDRTFYFARYFMKPQQDSWYVGGAAYNERLTSSSDCGESAMSGAIPMVGYYWVWNSGFNLDLGLRPGILALGFSF